MPELATQFQVVAIDQRGCNKSDQPRWVENYALDRLVADVDAVVKHFKANKAVVVGHDWGGLVGEEIGCDLIAATNARRRACGHLVKRKKSKLFAYNVEDAGSCYPSYSDLALPRSHLSSRS